MRLALRRHFVAVAISSQRPVTPLLTLAAFVEERKRDVISSCYTARLRVDREREDNTEGSPRELGVEARVWAF